MSKYIVGYCPNCGQKTKHLVIDCEDSAGWRVFEGLCTIGLSFLCFDHNYHCECTRCGKINTLSR